MQYHVWMVPRFDHQYYFSPSSYKQRSVTIYSMSAGPDTQKMAKAPASEFSQIVDNSVGDYNLTVHCWPNFLLRENAASLLQMKEYLLFLNLVK